MTTQDPQTPAHGEVEEIRPQVAAAQVAPVEAVPAYYTPDSLLTDLVGELRYAKEQVAHLTRANEALTEELRNMRPVHINMEPKP